MDSNISSNLSEASANTKTPGLKRGRRSPTPDRKEPKKTKMGIKKYLTPSVTPKSGLSSLKKSQSVKAKKGAKTPKLTTNSGFAEKSVLPKTVKSKVPPVLSLIDWLSYMGPVDLYNLEKTVCLGNYIMSKTSYSNFIKKQITSQKFQRFTMYLNS